jgi:hypothetical protein
MCVVTFTLPFSESRYFSQELERVLYCSPAILKIHWVRGMATGVSKQLGSGVVAGMIKLIRHLHFG